MDKERQERRKASLSRLLARKDHRARQQVGLIVHKDFEDIYIYILCLEQKKKHFCIVTAAPSTPTLQPSGYTRIEHRTTLHMIQNPTIPRAAPGGEWSSSAAPLCPCTRKVLPSLPLKKTKPDARCFIFPQKPTIDGRYPPHRALIIFPW